MPPAQINRPGALRLTDGRRLTFVETGPRDGAPVVYCHGAIGSPLRDAVNLGPLAERLHVRHIAVNRPGFGGSDLVGGRTVTAFATDLRALVNALEIERFFLIGVSAGGPYALAAAHALGHRVIRAAVCSSLSPLCAPHRTPGMAPRIRLGLAAVAAMPRTSRRVGHALLPLLHRHPGVLHRVIAAHAAPTERARLGEAGEREAAGTSFLNATAYGVGGMIEDYLTYSRGWGFRPEDVEPEVQVWHGGRDPLVPVEHALQLAVSLPVPHLRRPRRGTPLLSTSPGGTHDRPAQARSRTTQPHRDERPRPARRPGGGMTDQAAKAARFLELHRPGDPLVMPNPWDAGSAMLMANLGFEALATTSSGFAATLGRLDGGVSRDEALTHGAELAQAVDVPISADLENCFADDPDGVAETARRAVAAGLAGFSIEDYDPERKVIYERELSIERVRAAVEVAHAAPGAPIVVTARAEGYLRESEPDRNEIIGRLQAYQEVGADVLFAPGPVDPETVSAIVSSVDRPVSVLARPGAPTVPELGRLGIARISVGGALAFAAIGGWVGAARELREQGTYAYFEQMAAGGKAARQAFG